MKETDMQLDRFFDSFELFDNAPKSIPKLRELILQLAVQGKLVEQDPNDEPASVLLEKIKAEKEQLIKNGKIKKPKPLPPITPSEAPYDLPKGWEWVRLRTVGHDLGQKKPDKTFAYIDVTSINKDAGSIIPNLQVLTPSQAPSRARKLVNNGTVIYSTVRPYLLNIAVIDREQREELIVSTAFFIIHPYSGICDRYVFHYLRSQPFIDYVNTQMKGMAYPAVNDSKMSAGPFPLPPLSEQHQIVEKVDSLMMLCDELEDKQSRQKTARISLNTAALDSMLSAKSAPAFKKDWHRIRDNFELFYDRPETVTKLRQSILQLAVQGKLVEQDPNDEPASMLLNGRFNLPDGYKRRRKILKKVSVRKPDAVRESHPSSWVYVTIHDLYEKNIVIDYADGNHGSLYPRKADFGDEGVTFVSAKDIIDGRVVWENCNKLSTIKADQLTKGWAQAGDVLLTHNATVGRVADVEDGVTPFLLGTSVTFYRLTQQALCSDYFFILLQSPVWQRQLEAIMQQTTRNQVSIQKQAFFYIPLPPIVEQKRIACKAVQLMTLCDELETKLKQSQSDSETLMTAMINNILEH